MPYPGANVHVDLLLTDTASRWLWRSVNHSFNASRSKLHPTSWPHAPVRIPTRYRRRWLANAPRIFGVEARGDARRLGVALPDGVFRACRPKSFRVRTWPRCEVSWEAMAGESAPGRLCRALRPGVNPDTVEAQMQSAIVYGSRRAPRRDTIDRGAVCRATPDYPMLLMGAMPAGRECTSCDTDAPGRGG